MSQSKKQSLHETVTNTFVGTIGSFLITLVTLKFVTDIVLASAITTVACTAWSLLRGYTIRRYFNSKTEKGESK
jgi:uncharacterized protein (DUF697 family)